MSRPASGGCAGLRERASRLPRDRALPLAQLGRILDCTLSERLAGERLGG